LRLGQVPDNYLLVLGYADLLFYLLAAFVYCYTVYKLSTLLSLNLVLVFLLFMVADAMAYQLAGLALSAYERVAEMV
jgi:hypothetical protein